MVTNGKGRKCLQTMMNKDLGKKVAKNRKNSIELNHKNKTKNKIQKHKKL